MGINKYEKAIETIPSFFENQLSVDPTGAGIFDSIKSIAEFDAGYVFFVNPENIQLQYASQSKNHLLLNSFYPLTDEVRKIVYSEKNQVFDSKSKLANLLNLKNFSSFALAKLSIRSTIFGFVLLCKNETNFYDKEDLNNLNAVGSIISYLIKDIELSNVFRIQLKALKDGILETSNAYKTIKEQNLKILESDRIKNEFLANISHELRTPLNAIIGFSEALSAEIFGGLNPKQKEYVDDIHVSGIHLLGMINEILDISKIEANAMNLNLSDFDLSRVLDEVTNIVNPLADKKKIKIIKQVSEKSLINADFQKISQILYNLLSNAIKFSHKNGEIHVCGEIFPDKFVLSVKDFGIGIEEKFHGKIFAKFVQLESAYTKKESSTGLGLTITKELIEMHGGKISLKSEVNEGSTFIVEIPQ